MPNTHRDRLAFLATLISTRFAIANELQQAVNRLRSEVTNARLILIRTGYDFLARPITAAQRHRPTGPTDLTRRQRLIVWDVARAYHRLAQEEKMQRDLYKEIRDLQQLYEETLTAIENDEMLVLTGGRRTREDQALWDLLDGIMPPA